MTKKKERKKTKPTKEQLGDLLEQYLMLRTKWGQASQEQRDAEAKARSAYSELQDVAHQAKKLWQELNGSQWRCESVYKLKSGAVVSIRHDGFIEQQTIEDIA